MAPSTIAGRYTVLRAVGHGGMGTVWLCRDEVLGREVAVKQVGRMPGESTTDVDRALREARSSAALNHPHVVSVFDAVEDGEHNWLVMEYVPSRTLAQVLASEGTLSPERTAWIGAQAAEGLAAAHRRGTVHRDVKPGNILVTDDDLVKITDFGIARTTGDAALTRTGLVIGTPSYLSPELARGDDPDLPADVWALGATLYAAVEGRPLYAERSNVISLITAIASEPTPPLQRAGFLTEPISRMLDRDPATRWSMDDAAYALRRLSERHPVGSPAPGTRPLTGPVGAAPVAPAATEAHELADTPADPAPATRERVRTTPPADPRRRGWLLPVAALVVLAVVGLGGWSLLQGDDDTDPSAGAPSASGSPTPSPDRTGDARPSRSPSPTTSSPTAGDESPSASPSESASAPDSAGAATGATGFVQDYYGLLPSDTRSAYERLSDGYRSGESYGDYRSFWATIDAVSVDDVVASGESTVDVTLT